MDLGLQGKVALVTGASSGIGRATALRFAAEGARVALVARRRDVLEEVAAGARACGAEPLVVTADMRVPADRKRSVDETAAHFGGMDVLVNAAGLMENGSIESTTLEDWRRTMDLDVDAVFEMMHHAVPYLAASRGSIVNLSSVCGARPFIGILAYAVAKKAIDQLTQCAALELAPKGIRVNAVQPGVVESELHINGGMSREHYAGFLQRAQSTHPLARQGQPEEIADMILYLASDRCGWVTGALVAIDGGRALTYARS